MECNTSGSRRNFMAINAYIKKRKGWTRQRIEEKAHGIKSI